MKLTKLALGLAAALMALPVSAREIEHGMGVTEVPDEPQRVVVLTNEGTEALLALGVTPVGAANSWNGDPWWDFLSEQLADTQPVGTESGVNIELVAALQPDLIIGTKLRHEEIYPQLSAIAPTVLSERLRGDWKVNLRLYAQTLGLEDKGEQVIADYDAHVAGLHDALGDAVNEKVSVIRFIPGQIRIYQLDSFSGVVLKDVGFDRPANQNVEEFAIRTGKESIPDMDGDRIFFFTYDTGNGEGTALRDEVLADPLWQSLTAVQEGNVHEVDDGIWNTAGGVIAANLMLNDIARIYGVE
ncbi:ABC transporter substrate-binding protein [Qingshengfaniella alkalisoli]|uniref:Iron-siderophore ABC transporter substrate-binding protein n=1 Tax=Qingshengfaniella alkalisoli TaxID=2599296 RepID=A0A5B8JA04_9RHOB|nr:iron-siderophore ABC transporter substrate-binding protein [Qingshengfaniella alkalisoli]QDY71050.1 iron-siderophore ABC transporter substrate-binding protein [Qingshengfaniella alkalisoli]